MLELPVHSETLVEDQTSGDAALEATPDLGTVCVVGLGYVGLPVAVAFGKQRATIGYDLSTKKIHNLKQHIDPTGEVATEELQHANMLTVTDDAEQIRNADYIIVAVPT